MAGYGKWIHIDKSAAAVTQANCPVSTQQLGDMGENSIWKGLEKERKEEMSYGHVGSKQ